MLLSTAYLPPIHYFQKIKNTPFFYLEKHEHYVKQSYRNRCNVYGANGIIPLTIPVIHVSDKEIISDKKISYVENWQAQHWKTIQSAYSNTPYFIYYADDIKSFYEKKYTFLFDFNLELLQLFLKKLKLNTEIKFTETFDKSVISGDFRYLIHPKNKIETVEFKPYTQVFENKHGFIPNLSILDLLFNEGPNASTYF